MEYFEKIIRPRAEMKVINNFVTLFTEAKEDYQKKQYNISVDKFDRCFDILEPIFDVYPKAIVLFYIMKNKYKLKHYESCYIAKKKLNRIINDIKNINIRDYLKIKAKIFVVDFLLNFINDNFKESILDIIECIKFIDVNEYNLDNRQFYFWEVIKTFLKVAKLTKTKNFELIDEEYNNMIFNAKNEKGKIVSYVDIKMKEKYKNFMSTKIRKQIYDKMNEDYNLKKYHKNYKDKVVNYLDKNIDICVRKNNCDLLLENFKTFLRLNKISIQNEFGITLKELINEQKNRIETFDAVFCNLVGFFSQIFKNYLKEELDTKDVMLNNESKNKRRISTLTFQRQNMVADAAKVFKEIKRISVVKAEEEKMNEIIKGKNKLKHSLEISYYDEKDDD
jgi:hypothetical protein